MSEGVTDVVARAARFIFDRANPDVPGTELRNRDQWFAETRDYWVRAATDLAALLEKEQAYIQCACGWMVIAPAREANSIHFAHKCDITTPYKNRGAK